jgi:hypothetical protein
MILLVSLCEFIRPSLRSVRPEPQILTRPRISNCAASVCIFREGRLKGYTRLALMVVWAALFLAYFIVFAKQLQQWDKDAPFRCYNTSAISNSTDAHPYAGTYNPVRNPHKIQTNVVRIHPDKIYIGITFFFIFLTFGYAIDLGLNLQVRFAKLQEKWIKFLLSSLYPRPAPKPGSEPERVAILLAPMTEQSIQTASMLWRPLVSADVIATDTQNFILRIAMLQCPLHIYSIFALRASNERYLEGGSAESEWVFGQIAAMVLLGGNILQIVDGIAGMHFRGN